MNSLSRYYLSRSQWSAQQLILTGDEAHHCYRVLRSKVGDLVEVFDGEGAAVTGEIMELGKDRVLIAPTAEVTTSPREKPIHLCQAIPKGGNMELIVQKAVELGVSTIQPLITAHTIARAEQLRKKQIKWQRIALEACKQCGQNYLPEIHPAIPYAEWVKQQEPESGHLRIIAALHPSSIPFAQVFSEPAQSARLLVGPEGDFSDTEYEQAFKAGFHAVSLGDIVLRVETATLYCLSVIKHELAR